MKAFGAAFLAASLATYAATRWLTGPRHQRKALERERRRLQLDNLDPRG